MTLNEEHALETYKSIIVIGTQSLKALQLLNGGAVIAVLAYLGNSSGSIEMAEISCPLIFLILGVTLSTLAYLPAYYTQFSLFNELAYPDYKGKSHMFYQRFAMFLLLASLVCFAIGSWFGVNALTA